MTDQVKLLEFVNKVSKTKVGSKSGVDDQDPRFKLLEKVVTEEMAEVALELEFRVHQTVEEIAKRCGKTKHRTNELLWELATTGVAVVNKKEGEFKFWHETWVPGIFEMVVNNKENTRKHPQIAKAFDDYGLLRNPVGFGNIPMGKGLMRVIPIASSLDGTSRVATSEEVNRYLENARVISVSDCSCRTSREEMGQGCGHLKEDMCIQLDDAAELYIRTGKAREISVSEAKDIMRRAEENGLMHQIPNTEGEGHTHAICNCCGCSCYALRAATMYNNPDMVRSNFTAKVDPDKCVGCGECVEYCPTNAIRLGQRLSGTIEEQKIVHIDKAWDTEWDEAKHFNPDYRINREETLDQGTAPCKTECPAHISIPGYIQLAAEGKYTEALKLIKKNNPFPAICGRVCPALCESACTRCQIDEAVAIDDIKKFIAEQDLNAKTRYIPEIKHDYTDKNIAIIGGGPSGLSCAYYLAVEGYKVTVFEKENTLGGMLQFGIPAFRLQKDVIQAEIDILRELGVTFNLGVTVGTDITIPELRESGFNAFFIAIGAQNGRALGMKDEDAKGIQTGVDFLRNVALEKAKKLTGKTVVIGGGNVAIDVARTAQRYGSTSTTMFCLESRKDMPALEDEIIEALEENIVINNSYGPKRFIVKDGVVKGVEFKKCLSVLDSEGKFNPVYDETDTLTVEANHVLVAVGQTFDWGNLLKGTKVNLNRNNTIIVDSFTLQSDDSDIFSGGDCVSGPRFAIDAIALGKEGAISIHRFVQRGQSLVYGRARHVFAQLDKSKVDFEAYDTVKRERSKTKHVKDLKGNFSDPRGILTEAQILAETNRCLKCGISIVDEYMCVGCGQCTTKCNFDAISLVKTHNAQGVDFSELKPTVIKHVLKRKVRIAFKNFKNLFKRRDKNA
ncbi:FAD-dependent oxidoreductase [Candidatus Izemoplasma sp. B36]|uniref:FAD-dependent oxidoreductase n=1 Tax=Candidatus Izemoplasma sp. B36 TaxID=3242468 RepID=UPI0035574456